MSVLAEGTPGHLSVALTSDIDEELEVYCIPCDHKGQRFQAHGFCIDCDEHLCRICFTSHKRHTLSKHHTLLDKASMHKASHQSSATANSIQPSGLTEPCVKHKQEMIKFYCQDHNTLICNVCVALAHPSNSCKVSYIPDLSYNIIDSQDYQTILENIHDISERFSEIKEHITNTVAKSNKSLTDVFDDIKEFRKEINKRLDELEEQVEEAAKSVIQENNKNLNDVESTCFDVNTYLETVSKSIEQLNTSKQSDKLFIALIQAGETVKDNEIKLKDVTNFDIKEYTFKQNEAIMTPLLTNESYLGTLSAVTLQIKTKEVLNETKLCVQTLRDKHVCLITGMTLVSTEHLAVTDSKNMTVKIVNTNSQCMVSQLKLPAEPWDIAAVSNTELAVTLPNKQAIQFISVLSNKMKMKRSIKVEGFCYGISCCQGKIIVFCQPSKLQIIDINDTVLTTVEGGTTFFYPMYATANSGFIYITDKEIRKLIRLNWQGDAISSYGDMLDPSKVVLSNNGTVFVCDAKRNVIEEVLDDCSRGKIVLTNLKGPQAICWCEDTNRMYVSCCNGDGMYDNFVQIYKLS